MDYAKYPYTICFIFNRDDVLMLNRDRVPWMGMWTGIGGKLESQDANPMDGVLREIEEEAGIPREEVSVRSIGKMEWYKPGTEVKGMYMFLATVEDEVRRKYLGEPRKFDEGLLDWKSREWVSKPENLGVVKNVQQAFEYFDVANEQSVFKSYFSGDYVVDRLEYETIEG